MASEQAKELRQNGIAAAKAGDKELARRLLQQSIRLEPKSEPAWLWLASVARDPQERVFCLRKILEINPANEQAKKAMIHLEEALTNAQPVATEPAPQPPGRPIVERIVRDTSPLSTPPTAPATPPHLTTQELMAQQSGVPIYAHDSAKEAADIAEEVVRRSLAQPVSTVNWVKKTHGRAGERDVWRLRAYIGIASAVALIAFCVGSFVIVSNTPELASVVFAPTMTPTFTPTFTPTSTPGVTPTASPTPRVAPRSTATLPPLFPTADVYSPDATAIYPEVVEAPLRGAIALLDRGDYEAALPTLASERINTSARFNVAPYYYEAVAQASSGNLSAALATLNDAEERLQEAPNANFEPLLNAGFAYVLNLQARAADERGDPVGAQAIAARAQTRAEATIQRDPRLVQGHLELARSRYLQGDFNGAIAALDSGLGQAALQFDTSLILEKSRMYFDHGDLASAERQSYLVLYADPSIQGAHQIQYDIAVRQDNPGLAVLRAQAYLFYYPGLTHAWRLLGDARLLEGNTVLAIQAYSQALTASGQDDETTAAVLRGRAQAYSVQGRYDLAEQDLAAAIGLIDSDAVRAERMVAAYLSRRFSTAQADAIALANSTEVAPGLAALIRGRAIVDEAYADGDPAGTEAIAQLQIARTGADEATLAIIDEYIAQAHWLNGNYADALESVDLALARGESAERYYLRGLILEARGQDLAAARAFDWVVSWSMVYPVPFAADAADHLESLRS